MAGEVLEVERHEGRAAALRPDRVVKLLKAADRASDRDDVGAGLGQRQRGSAADAPRGAGDDGDAIRRGFAGHPVPVRSRTRLGGERSRASSSPSAASTSRVG